MFESITKDTYPIMGELSLSQRFAPIDLSITNPELPKNIDYDTLTDYIDQYKQIKNVDYPIGGYLEHRNLYGLSSHFTTSLRRDIHLGVDIWTDAGHPVFAPIDGLIHSFAFNQQDLDYGYTLILEHEIHDLKIYTLYGHLSSEYYKNWNEGDSVMRGSQIATLGDPTENGGWPPHLHFQVILDIGDWKGDFPGVCSKSELDKYANNCPNPSVLLHY